MQNACPAAEMGRARYPPRVRAQWVSRWALLGRGARLLGGGRLAGVQRHDRGERVFGELPLRGEQLLSEVVGSRHELRRLRELVSERNIHVGQRRLDGLDSVGPRLDRVDDCFLALADRLQDLALKLLRGGRGGHDSSSYLLKTIVSKIAIYVKRSLGILSTSRRCDCPTHGAARPVPAGPPHAWLCYSRSNTAAMPWPPPMHMVTKPYRPPVRRSSYSAFTTRIAPVAPIGCPKIGRAH